METILVVDDNAGVRSIVRLMLEHLGYAVLEAGGEGELLDLLDGHRIDLLMTDLVLPRSDGAQLAARAATRLSGLKILYISGYPRSYLDRYGLADGAQFLQKPFTPAALARAVQEALS